LTLRSVYFACIENVPKQKGLKDKLCCWISIAKVPWPRKFLC